jgi:hypothetical protein
LKLRIILSLVAAAVAASLVTVGAVSVGAARPTLPWLRAAPCTHVDVVASSEKAALMSAIAADFDRAGFQQDGACVQVRVHSMDSGAAERALARGATAFGPIDLTARSPLYGAVGRAVDAMSADGSYDPARINAVLLLTNGADDSTSGVDRTQLLDRLRRTDEARNVPVFAIAYGGAPGTATLDAITAASRGRAYSAGGAGSVDDVFTQVVGNF